MIGFRLTEAGEGDHRFTSDTEKIASTLPLKVLNVKSCRVVLSPSAIVFTLPSGKPCTTPVSRDLKYIYERERETLAKNQIALDHFMMGGLSYRLASSAASGSTPITIMLGLNALMTALMPLIRLPPPTGTTTTGTGYCNNFVSC